MDRLSWYQAGESMEEILRQAAHVGIYDGDLKQVCFANLQTYSNPNTFSLHLSKALYHLRFSASFGLIVLIRYSICIF